MIFLAGTLVWSLAYALHWSSVSPESKRYWLDATYLGVVVVAPSMFLFILEVIQPQHPVRRGLTPLMYVIPLLTLGMLVSDARWGLFYGGKLVPGQSRIYDGGPGFWINLVYIYSLTLTSLVLLLRALRSGDALQREQARILLLGTMVPVLTNVALLAASSVFGINAFVGLDPTPIAFSFTGLVLLYGLLNDRLLGLTSVGRDVVVEQMSEGMLLLSADRRIADLNPAARRLLGLPQGSLVGLRIQDALSARPELAQLFEQDQATTTELCLTAVPRDPFQSPAVKNRERYLRIQLSPLSISRGHSTGMVVICHDITERKDFEHSLQRQLLKIQALQKDLKDQATRDPLTGIFNRRYIYETLPRELARASRDGSSLSLVMLDLDHFKRLNDAHGHPAGDLLLERLAQVLSENTRRGDIVARVGGEEFLVALPDTTTEAARKRAEQWRSDFSNCAVPYEGNLLQTTVSAGISTFPQDGADLAQLIRRADEALYRAKAAGRNRVVVFDEPS